MMTKCSNDLSINYYLSHIEKKISYFKQISLNSIIGCYLKKSSLSKALFWTIYLFFIILKISEVLAAVEIARSEDMFSKLQEKADGKTSMAHFAYSVFHNCTKSSTVMHGMKNMARDLFIERRNAITTTLCNALKVINNRSRYVSKSE